jgi:hypothetical protein
VSPLHYEELEEGMSRRSQGRTITEAVTQAVEVRNQNDEVVAQGEFATLVLRRDPA